MTAAITKLKVTATLDHTLHCSWVGSGTGANAVEVKWKTDPRLAWRLANRKEFVWGTQAADITGLQDGVTVYIQVVPVQYGTFNQSTSAIPQAPIVVGPPHPSPTLIPSPTLDP